MGSKFRVQRTILLLKKLLNLPPSCSQLMLSALLLSNCDNVVIVTTLWSEASDSTTDILNRKIFHRKNSVKILKNSLPKFVNLIKISAVDCMQRKISGMRSQLISCYLVKFQRFSLGFTKT